MIDIFLKRQSDRAYLPQPVEPEKIERILDAARLAPSACNAQPWKFIVVTDPDIKNQLADATSAKVLNMNHWTKQAPVHIVIVEESANFSSNAGSLIKRRHFPLIDIGIAASHICLQATAEGLGTCMIGWFNERKVKKILKIPRGKRPHLIITVGYPAGETRQKIRKTLEQIRTYNHY
ncbi:MAG TPA: nitroreductase family protein [Salinivirgaceae bacterium]|nr:nitroreductase family protein [Salinivirgaceae bacterium]